MFGITFLSTKDREMLVTLRDALMTVTDPTIREKIGRKISELSEKEKPLTKCNIEDCVDLQMQLNNKLQLALQAGKPQMARSINMLLNSVNERYMSAQMESMQIEAIKEHEAQQVAARAELSKILGTKVNDPKDKKGGTGKSGTSKPTNSWTVDFGEAD